MTCTVKWRYSRGSATRIPSFQEKGERSKPRTNVPLQDIGDGGADFQSRNQRKEEERGEEEEKVKGVEGEAGESQSLPFYRRRASVEMLRRGSNRRGGDVGGRSKSGSVIDAKTSGQMGTILSL